MTDTVLAHHRRQPITRRRRSLLAVSFLCVPLIAAGCDFNLPGKPNPKNRPVPAEDVLTFATLYNTNCAGCHGPDGKQGPAPPLNDPLFRAIVPLDDLKKVLDLGRPGTSMAPFAHDNGGPLTPAQIQVLIHGVKGLRYRIEPKISTAWQPQEIAPPWGAVEPAPTSIPPYALGKGGGSEQRGAKLFAQACASCHGDNGKGIVRDDQIRNKINDQTFLALISDQALRRIIITGRPDLKMPNYSQKNGRSPDFQPLTSAEIDDLVALLSSGRKGLWVGAK
jgi:cytochrome c oxidase cbb3-type subunit III